MPTDISPIIFSIVFIVFVVWMAKELLFMNQHQKEMDAMIRKFEENNIPVSTLDEELSGKKSKRTLEYEKQTKLRKQLQKLL